MTLELTCPTCETSFVVDYDEIEFDHVEDDIHYSIFCPFCGDEFDR